ncbi:CARDB domain-containing protein [Vandammella animalimorsus]|nr:CARDB domain-containing protein [Vandammella animalimorsus]
MTKINSPRPGRLWQLSATAAALWLAVALPQAHAQVTDVIYANAYDGALAPFDIQTGPGYDNERNNNIVRTNDAFAYSVSLRSQYPATGAKNITVKAQFPANTLADWQSPSAQLCDGGITISNDHAAGPQLSCTITTLAASGTRNLTFIAHASGKAPNGHRIAKPTFSIDVGGNQGSTAIATNDGDLQDITVSAYPFYDVVVQPSFQGSPKPYGFYAGNGPNGEDGFYHRPLVGLRAMHPNAGRGRIGVEMLNGQPIELNIQLNERGLKNAQLVTWDTHSRGARGSFLVKNNNSKSKGCGSPANGSLSAYLGGGVNMHGLVSDAGAARDVRSVVPNGGVCSVAQSAPGGAITLTLTGVDTSLQRRPSHGSGSAGNAIPQDEWWVANKALVLWTPMADYPPHNPPNAVVKYPHEISVAGIKATSISGAQIAINSAAELGQNNKTSYELWRENKGNYSKRYAPDGKRPIPEKTLQDPAVIGDINVNHMAVGQSVSARLIYSNTGTATHTNAYICETIDRTAFRLGDRHEVRGMHTGDRLQYGRRPAGKYFASTSVNDKNDEYQYGTTHVSDYRDAGCADPKIEWGDLKTIGRDNVVYIRIGLGDLKGGESRSVFIDDLILEDTWQASIDVKTGGAAGVPAQRNRGESIAPATRAEGQLILNRAEVGSDFYSPAVLMYDYLRVVPSRTVSRISKQITSPAAPPGGDAPVVARGGTVKYGLKARYSTHTPLLKDPQGKYVVTVVDYLPPHMDYVDGSEKVASINGGNVNSYSFRKSKELNGATKLEWVFDQVVPVVGDDNDAAEFAQIAFDAKVADNAPASTSALMSNTAITSNFDTEGACKLDKVEEGFYLMVPGDVKTSCEKSATATVLLGANNGAYDILKQAVMPDGTVVQGDKAKAEIRPGDEFGYQLTYEAKDFANSGVNIPHWIDVLPWVGDSRGSAFADGAYRLKSVSAVDGDPAAKVYYTNRAPASIQIDPRHADNTDDTGAVNTVNWCELSSCGFAIDKATAIHIVPGVNAMPLGQKYKLRLTFETDAAIAKPGDKYANMIHGRSPTDASTLQLVSKPAQHHVYIPNHSLSGQVFWDKNGNGALDASPAADEAIAGNNITLTGCLAGADGVIDTTDVAAGCHANDQAFTQVVKATTADGKFEFTGLATGIYTLAQGEDALGDYKNGVTLVGSVGGSVTALDVVPSRIENIKLEGATAQAGTGYLFGEVKVSAVNDDYTTPALPTTGGTTPTTDPVTKNDLANDSAVDLDPTTGNATISGIGVVGGDPATGGLVLNPNGTITVQPNTPAGTYEYEYQLCLRSPYETVCATAEATVKVEAAGTGGNNILSGKVYFDKDDDGQPQAGEPGIQNTKLVLYGCTAGSNGALDTNEINVPAAGQANWCKGDDEPVELETATDSDGDYVFSSLDNGLYIVVQPDQPAGYSNGKTSAGNAGGVPSQVADLPSYIKNIALNNDADAKYNNFGELQQAPPTIKAQGDDLGSYKKGVDSTTPSVLADNGSGADKANGADATLTNVTLKPISTSDLNVTLDAATGLIKVGKDAPLGTHTVEYEICLVSHPTICAKATETVHVVSIDAVDDDMGTIPSTGGKTPSVVADNNGNGGDKANGLPAVIGTNVTLKPGALPNPPATGGLEMNPDGTITVKPGTPAGTYEYPYEICLLPATTPATCSNAVATVKVNDVKVDLQVIKSVDKLAPNVGETVRFTLEVKNLGSADATGVKVVDQLPSGYEFVAAQSPAYDAATGVWTLGNLANGASASLWIDAKVKPAGEYRNTATVDSDQSDVVQSNNRSSVQPAPVGAPSASPVPVPANAPWALLLMMLAVLMLARQGRLGRR